MTDQTARAHLHGGPKAGWVYDVPLHADVVMGHWQTGLPPEEIVTPNGRYVRRKWSVTPDGGFDYDWEEPAQ